MEYWVAKFPKQASLAERREKYDALLAFDIEYMDTWIFEDDCEQIWFYEKKPGVAEEIRQKLPWITSLKLKKPLMLEVVHDDDDMKEVKKK